MESLGLSQKDAQPGINGGELRGQPANPGSPGKMAVKTVWSEPFVAPSSTQKVPNIVGTTGKVRPGERLDQQRDGRWTQGNACQDLLLLELASVQYSI